MSSGKKDLEAHGLQAGWRCGAMFGRSFYRHRLFATNFLWLAPEHPRHKAVILPGRLLKDRASRLVTNGAQADDVGVGHAQGWRLAAVAMGIDWMRRSELTQAIPPVYTQYVGRYLLQAIDTSGGQEDDEP